MPLSLHPDAKAILERLQRERISALYHFTSVENLPYIRQMQALCSKEILQRVGVWPPVPGGNRLSHDLDRSRGNWDKVCLNFTPHTPMVYHKKREHHLCFLVIDLEVTTWSNVLFTNTNATSNECRRGAGLIGLDNVDFRAIRSHPQPWDREGWVKPVQAEVLVPDKIPLNHVINVAFVSEASRSYGERLWGNFPRPPFQVNTKPFSDSSLTSRADFTHLIKVLLTDDKVDDQSAISSHVHKSTFERSIDERITLLSLSRVVAGTEAKVVWRPVNVMETTEFETSADYYYWPHILLHQLPNGLCSVEYFVGDILWSTIDFEVRD